MADDVIRIVELPLSDNGESPKDESPLEVPTVEEPVLETPTEDAPASQTLDFSKYENYAEHEPEPESEETPELPVPAQKNLEKKQKKSKRPKEEKKKSQKYALPLGIIVILFSVIGFVFAVYHAITGFAALLDNSDAEKEKYQKMLVPVVMNDINEFDDVTKADMAQLIEASIWSIIKSDVETDKYEMDGDNLLFPAADVETAFTSLFGTDVEIQHQTVFTTAFEFEYDSEKKVYKVPITGVDPTYTPRVLDISEKSNTVILTVAYLSGGDWTQSANGDLVPPSPSKYVKVTLRKKDKSYYISAIQATDAP